MLMDALIRVLVQLMTFTRSCRPAPDVSRYLPCITTSTVLHFSHKASVPFFFFLYLLFDVFQNITNSLCIKVAGIITEHLNNIESTGC
jgi:hypothetical protein